MTRSVIRKKVVDNFRFISPSSITMLPEVSASALSAVSAASAGAFGSSFGGSRYNRANPTPGDPEDPRQTRPTPAPAVALYKYRWQNDPSSVILWRSTDILYCGLQHRTSLEAVTEP